MDVVHLQRLNVQLTRTARIVKFVDVEVALKPAEPIRVGTMLFAILLTIPLAVHARLVILETLELNATLVSRHLYK